VKILLQLLAPRTPVSPVSLPVVWKKSPRFFPTSRPFYTPWLNQVIRPGTTGQERATMNEQIFRQGFSASAEFKNHPRNECGNRFLSDLWELYHRDPSSPEPAMTDRPLH